MSLVTGLQDKLQKLSRFFFCQSEKNRTASNYCKVRYSEEEKALPKTFDHECDYSEAADEDVENDLQEHSTDCQKNPGHRDFIPVNDFLFENLPKRWQNPDIFKLIKTAADLTVRLRVKCISEDRPDVFPDTWQGRNYQGYELKAGKEFPFGEKRGKICTISGTGFVVAVKSCNQENNRKCLCEENCTASKWREIIILTANHVVFDSKEAVRTSVDFFYDDESKQGMRTLEGRDICYGQVEGDYSTFVSYTHNEELLDRLEYLLKRKDTISRNILSSMSTEIKMQEIFNEERNTHDFLDMIKNLPENHELLLTVICSHPHGSPKMISLGQHENLKIVSEAGVSRYELTYKTATCPGSSGAPVIPLWRLFVKQNRFTNFNFNHHSGLCLGVNKSGAERLGSL